MTIPGKGMSPIQDPRSVDEYWADAEKTLPVWDGIKKWFPTKNAKDAVQVGPAKPKVPMNGARKKMKNRKKNGEQAAHSNGQEAEIPELKELSLPSWVARITGAPFDIFPHPGMDMVKMGRKNADPLVGIPQDGHRNYNAAQLNKVDLNILKITQRKVRAAMRVAMRMNRSTEVIRTRIVPMKKRRRMKKR